MMVGLLFEGSLDREAIKVLTARLIANFAPDKPVKFVFVKADGPIDVKMEPSAVRFFEEEDSCDFAIFLSDVDKDPKNVKRKRINAWIRNYFLKKNKSIIPVFPNPTFEQWFFAEENALKQIFPAMNPTSPIPYSDLKPKERLKKIVIEFSNDITVSPKDVYPLISEILDLHHLATKDVSFRRFNEKMGLTLRSIGIL